MYSVLVGFLATATSLLAVLLVVYRGESSTRSLYSEVRLTIDMEKWRGLARILLENAFLASIFLATRFTLFVWVCTWLPDPPASVVHALWVGPLLGAGYAVAYRFVSAVASELARRSIRHSNASAPKGRFLSPLLVLLELVLIPLNLDWNLLQALLRQVEQDRQRNLWQVVRSAKTAMSGWRGYASLLHETVGREWFRICDGMDRVGETTRRRHIMQSWHSRPFSEWIGPANQGGLIASVVARALSTEGFHKALQASAATHSLEMQDIFRPVHTTANMIWRSAMGGAIITTFATFGLPLEAGAQHSTFISTCNYYMLASWALVIVALVFDLSHSGRRPK
jgi:hypothetical protein